MQVICRGCASAPVETVPLRCVARSPDDTRPETGPRWPAVAEISVDETSSVAHQQENRPSFPIRVHIRRRSESQIRQRRQLRRSAATDTPGRDTATNSARSSTSGYRFHVSISANASAPVMKKICDGRSPAAAHAFEGLGGERRARARSSLSTRAQPIDAAHAQRRHRETVKWRSDRLIVTVRRDQRRE